MKREAGFTLIELLITVVLIGFVLAGTSDMFVGLLRSYRQQSKITETNVEGIISLEMLRRDIESAGYGLPWTVSTPYQEVDPSNAGAAVYNDSPTSSPPRAILSAPDANGRAYLVIKAMNLARNDACTKWTILQTTGAPTVWSSSAGTSENLQDTDQVVLISPGSPATISRALIDSGSFSAIKTEYDPGETRLIYGVDDSNLRMPFNRADYSVNTVNVPRRCAPGTGVLVKAVVSQANGGFTGNTFPLLDCVADMQVVTFLDTDNDGTADTLSTGLWAADAQTIRNQLKEVHVYILAHEGQRDVSYTYFPSTVLVGEQAGLTVYGRNFDLTTIANWQNYRWKVYTLVVRPKSLR